MGGAVGLSVADTFLAFLCDWGNKYLGHSVVSADLEDDNLEKKTTVEQ